MLLSFPRQWIQNIEKKKEKLKTSDTETLKTNTQKDENLVLPKKNRKKMLASINLH